MYTIVLAAHSWLRWAALIAGVLAILTLVASRPMAGPPGKRDASDRWGMLFTAALDLQMVLGLLLYFALSPNTTAIFGNFGAAMRDPVARFWAVEHLSMMIGALIVAHVGRVLARKAVTPAARRSRLLICFGVALVLMLVATPWPGRPAGRPLFRL